MKQDGWQQNHESLISAVISEYRRLNPVHLVNPVNFSTLYLSTLSSQTFGPFSISLAGQSANNFLNVSRALFSRELSSAGGTNSRRTNSKYSQ